MYANLSKTIKEFDVSYRKGRAKISDQEFDSLVMKPKSFQIEAYTISETSRILGYKSTKTLYRLLNSNDIGFPINKGSLIIIYLAVNVRWIIITFLIPVIS